MLQPPSRTWNHTVEGREYTVEQCKEAIYLGVIAYERTHNTLGRRTGPATAVVAARRVLQGESASCSEATG